MSSEGPLDKAISPLACRYHWSPKHKNMPYGDSAHWCWIPCGSTSASAGPVGHILADSSCMSFVTARGSEAAIILSWWPSLEPNHLVFHVLDLQKSNYYYCCCFNYYITVTIIIVNIINITMIISSIIIINLIIVKVIVTYFYMYIYIYMYV